MLAPVAHLGLSARDADLIAPPFGHVGEAEEKLLTEKAVTGRSAWSRLFDELTADIKDLYANLLELKARGGGDWPESVNEALDAAVKLFADPFYRNGPNDQGIGWNVLSSLQRVGIGFGFAALVGIPLGFILGRSAFLSAMVNPIISLLRPVSPLAWLPIGLLVFKAANPAAIWTIFICSIWPMIMNTAQGVQRVPQDYLNVARVLALSEWKVVTKILFPAVLPYMLTGIRLSIGTAWLVIVAAEMLTGGVGIGFWVWDEWNNLKVEHIIIAIFVIGIVGLILEQSLILLAKKLTKESS